MNHDQQLVELAYKWLSRSDYSKVPENLKAEKKAFRRACGSWIRHDGIVGYGVGRKVSDGSTTEHPALQVFVHQKTVSSKLDRPLIPRVLRIPHFNECILLDVVQQSTGTTACRRLAGDGIRQNDRAVGPGSIGCFVTSTSNTAYAVSCWHVAALGKPGGTPVQWCDDPEGLLPNSSFGTLDRHLSPIRRDSTGRVRDMALIRINNGVDISNSNSAGIGIRGVRTTPIEMGESLRLYGFGSKQLNYGTVTNAKAVNTIEYDGIGGIVFTDCIKSTGMSTKGDSGSVAIDGNGMGVGVLVGGNSHSDQPWSAFVPLVDVLEHFNVRIRPDNARQSTSAIAADVDVLARTLWGEAEGEPRPGKIAVANVIMNRVYSGNPRRHGSGVQGVCKKNNGQTWQFSCWGPRVPRRDKLESVTTQSGSFRECLDIAAMAVKGELEDLTEGSLHYHAYWVSPSWSAGKDAVLVVGDHWFFNNVA